MGYLAAAFIVLWVLVTAYLLYMGIRQRQLEREVDILRSIANEQNRPNGE